jgi:uncharacterized membrane protein required for colicin V production
MITSNASTVTNNKVNEVVRRVLMGLLVFAVVMALSLLLPQALPGELSRGEMTAVTSNCGACPRAEKIVAAGMVSSSDGVYVNVEFAAPPTNSRLSVAFSDTAGEVRLVSSAGNWSFADGPRSSIELMNVAQRERRVVLQFPGTLRADRFAVTTGSGDRFPLNGFADAQYPASARFNFTDVLLLLAMTATAWYGARRGFLLEIADLVVLVVGLAIAAMVHRPVVSLFSGVTDSAATAAGISSVVTVVAVVFAGIFFVRKYLPKITASVGTFATPSDAVLGATTGCLRQLPLLAMMLAFSTNLAALSWASPNVHSSLIGSALVHAWKSVFTA